MLIAPIFLTERLFTWQLYWGLLQCESNRGQLRKTEYWFHRECVRDKPFDRTATCLQARC